jgi:hypothetical protein
LFCSLGANDDVMMMTSLMMLYGTFFGGFYQMFFGGAYDDYL